MNKFEDVDVITSLEAIMKQNTAFYQNDFDLDRNILQKAAASPTAEDRRLLWPALNAAIMTLSPLSLR